MNSRFWLYNLFYYGSVDLLVSLSFLVCFSVASVRAVFCIQRFCFKLILAILACFG
jgi:hypothetical protein